MQRPQAYKARFSTLSAVHTAWAHRGVTWVTWMLPLPCMLLPWHPASLLVLPLLGALPWAFGGALGEILSTLPKPIRTLAEPLRMLRPRVGRLVWLGLRYVFELALAALGGLAASGVIALIYFVLSVATGFIDHRLVATVLDLALQTCAAVACVGCAACLFLRVTTGMFMAPVWVARGLDVPAALLRSRQFAAGRFWHIASLVVWLNLLPGLAALAVFLMAPDTWQSGPDATGLDIAPLLAQLRVAVQGVYVAHWVMAPIAAMAPASMERQELAWAMPPGTQVVAPQRGSTTAASAPKTSDS